MVHLQKIHETSSSKGVLVFAIAMHADAEVARRLTRELKITYPVFQGFGSELGRAYAYG
jgi:hypothetical protein